MTYKELLHLYKNEQLNNEQRKQVEKDIEKQEAISEYLFDNEQIPEFSDLDIQKDNSDRSSDPESEKLLKMIKKSIRRAFIKAGIAITAVVLALVLLITSALPHIVDAMYYNPAQVMGEVNGIETNRMTLDTAVYTELFTPGYYRTKVNVESEGYGEYDIHIPQNTSDNGQFRDVYGTIDKGTLTLFSDGLLKAPTENAFVPDDLDEVIAGSFAGFGAAGTAESAARKLLELDETDYYVGYITLDKVMTYTDLVAWSEKTGITPDWCAVCQKQNADEYTVNNIIGFNYVSDGSPMGYDKEEYPYLNYCDMIETVENFPEEPFSADVMETHMISMLRYIRDNKTFRELTGSVISDNEFTLYADNIAEYGLNIYGFAIVAQKDTLIEISRTENVYYVYTEPLR